MARWRCGCTHTRGHSGPASRCSSGCRRRWRCVRVWRGVLGAGFSKAPTRMRECLAGVPQLDNCSAPLHFNNTHTHTICTLYTTGLSRARGARVVPPSRAAPRRQALQHIHRCRGCGSPWGLWAGASTAGQLRHTHGRDGDVPVHEPRDDQVSWLERGGVMCTGGNGEASIQIP